jgi:hypothetical protein
MQQSFRLGSTLSAIALFLGSFAAQAQIFNSGTGYTDSITTVAGSPWTYGTVTTPTSFDATSFDTAYYFTVDSDYNGLGQPTYPPGDATTLIGLGNLANDSRVQYDAHATPNLSGTQTLPPFQVTLRQDESSSTLDPFARFTASNSVAGSVGTFALSVAFIPTDTNFNANAGDTGTFSVVLLDPTNGASTLFSQTITGTGIAGPNTGVSYDGTIALAAGDELDFVESGENNTVATTTLDATLTAVPENSTLACVCLGLAVLSFLVLRPAGMRQGGRA